MINYSACIKVKKDNNDKIKNYNEIIMKFTLVTSMKKDKENHFQN